MMNLNKVYKLNPHVVFSTKEGITKVISLEEENNELINLTGLAGDCLKLFDGKISLAEIKQSLEKKANIAGKDEDFLKMIEFFLSKNLITELL